MTFKSKSFSSVLRAIWLKLCSNFHQNAASTMSGVLIVFNLCKACRELVNASLSSIPFHFNIALWNYFFSHYKLKSFLLFSLIIFTRQTTKLSVTYFIEILSFFLLERVEKFVERNLKLSPDGVDEVFLLLGNILKRRILKAKPLNNLSRKFEKKLCKVFISRRQNWVIKATTTKRSL